MSFCLPQEESNKLLDAIKTGKFSPSEYGDMKSTSERQAYVAKFVGETDAKEVNTELESKMLLKDWQRGMVSAVKKVTGLTEAAKTDLVSKIGRMDHLLNPTEEKAFYADITAKRLGVRATLEEANTIASLAKGVTDAQKAIPETDPKGSDARLQYGSKLVALQNYIGDIKKTDSTFLENMKTKPAATLVRSAIKSFSFAKALKNVGDLSSLFHQGWKALTTHPVSWAKNAVRAVADAGVSLTRSGTNSAIIDGIKAEILSRPYAIDGTYRKMGLEVGNTEEQLPSTLPEKIPLFGSIYKATETGFTGFLYRTRADLADLYLDAAKDNGINLNDKTQVESIGNMVNALTGRGKLAGATTDTNFMNAAIYSQKLFKSNFDFLTAHQFQKDVTPFVRKAAAINLLKSVMATAAILATAKAIQPKSVTYDPTATDFGKVKVGNVAFDVTGGMGSMAVLASRLAMNRETTSTGKVDQLNTGKFGSLTSKDVIMDYVTGKLSPVASVLLDLVNRTTWNGQPLTVQGEAMNAVAPFPVQNYIAGLQGGLSPADSLISEIADSFGLFESLPAPKKK